MKRYNEFASEIKDLKARKLNNAEIAEHLGISKSQVRKFASDKYEEIEESYNENLSDYSYSSDDSDVNDIISTMNGYRYSE
jgi:predicted transcriptional regulator